MKFRYQGIDFGTETIDGTQTLVAYFKPIGAGYMHVPHIDVSKMETKTIPESRRVRRAIDRSSGALRGID
ncbi:MAG: hypothetical protein WC613_02030 [Candidatus Aenigmatarchaeota archaeon]